ncbi:MAG TPA: heavy-metal-associated domain-containing protein [Nitrososphaeraceae archaeon]|nr:heavy-metal-associated domain-containing protein [Nitrososphaeraceae archaeon]
MDLILGGGVLIIIGPPLAHLFFNVIDTSAKVEKEIKLRFAINVMFKVVGMYCSICRPIVEKQLEEEKGVKNIDIDYMTDSVIIDFDPLLITKEEIKNRLGKSEYNFSSIIRRRFSTKHDRIQLHVFVRMLFRS